MSTPASAVDAALAGVLILATAVWLGGYVAIAVVARVASRTLDPPARVSLFRGLGRAYGVIGVVALLIALGTGGTLATNHPWDGSLAAAVALACALVVASVTGMVQARRMSRLRRRAHANPDDAALTDRVTRGARRAGLLRALIGLLTLALLAVGMLLTV